MVVRINFNGDIILNHTNIETKNTKKRILIFLFKTEIFLSLEIAKLVKK